MDSWKGVLDMDEVLWDTLSKSLGIFGRSMIAA